MRGHQSDQQDGQDPQLWISLGVVALLVPATLFGLNLGAAVVFHEGSTLLVVANALRLLAYRDPTAT
jgi:Cd2+/Zn2+-exporting ATPase